MITEMRMSDGYMSATKMCQSAGKTWADYKDGHRAFMDGLTRAVDRSDVVQTSLSGPNHQRGTWIHPQVAMNLAMWCSPQFAVKVIDLVVRYGSGQVTAEETRAATEHGDPVEETCEEYRALKRLKVQNEIEMEKAKHANEMAKVQSEAPRLRVKSTQQLVEESMRLCRTLVTSDPSLIEMINRAHNNLIIKSLRIEEVDEFSQDTTE
ncbi:hypothetical protein KFL_009080060 [Klebsormidium nitens]|uniref:KilA-N domain-containing protein n=1 Tax=Klebsormidium nitens TaxID=105231 RepID=A0A1Y1ITA6_KLENI|nr:hypothetical protein KFL_009080060 [Klebsormidium nitens]|eukprot:GAQ92036.1 hypothetical protein KFL_009080060 [Klebsormidium nitens]